MTILSPHRTRIWQAFWSVKDNPLLRVALGWADGSKGNTASVLWPPLMMLAGVTGLGAATNEWNAAHYSPSLNGKPWPRFPVVAFVESASNIWVHPLAPNRFPTVTEIHDPDSDCRAEAVESYLGQRFGEKRVGFDPSDPEANKLAVSQGYTVVHGSMMSGGAWKNAKAAGAIQPAGQVTPGPKVWTGEDNPNAIPFEDWIPESKWTDGMRAIADFAKRVAEKVLARRIVVKFCATAHHLGGASYGPSGELVFNKFRLGADWFEQGITEEVVRLLIHEFGHQYSPDDLSAQYHEALCRIGARMFLLTRQGRLA